MAEHALLGHGPDQSAVWRTTCGHPPWVLLMPGLVHSHQLAAACLQLIGSAGFVRQEQPLPQGRAQPAEQVAARFLPKALAQLRPWMSGVGLLAQHQ